MNNIKDNLGWWVDAEGYNINLKTGKRRWESRLCPTCGNPIIVTLEEKEWLRNGGKSRTTNNECLVSVMGAVIRFTDQEKTIFIGDDSWKEWDRILDNEEVAWLLEHGDEKEVENE